MSEDRRGAKRVRTGWAVLVVAGAVAVSALVGCTSIRSVPFERVPPEGLGKTRVVLSDGYTYDFGHVFTRGDTLIGVYTVVEEHIDAQGQVIYVDTEHRTLVPLTTVKRLETKRVDLSKSMLLGAGAVIGAIYIHGIMASDEDEEEDSGSGKPKQ